MLLVEANFSEFQKRYKRGEPFALISAFQGNLDKDTNKQNNVTLRDKIKANGYEVIRVLGHYKEDDEYFENMIVFCKENNYKEFVRFLLYFGRRYRQNSIVVVDPENNIWEYATKNGSTVGGMGSKRRYDKYLNSSPSELESMISSYAFRTYELDYVRLVND